MSVIAGVLFGANHAHASEDGGIGPQAVGAPATTTSDGSSDPLHVRVTMSEGAAKRLSELRVRRLLALELYGNIELDEPHVGTLEGDALIRVWIDVPMDRRAVVEVRRVDGSFARRALVIGGFPSDVAAEVVTLAAAEMVRVQAREMRAPAPEPTPPKKETTKAAPLFSVDAAASALWLPGSHPGFVIGPELGLSLRHGMFGHRLYGRWQIGADETSRWLEIGTSIDYRFNFSEDWRVHLGAKGGFASVSLPTATSIDDSAETQDWTVRLAGEVGIEARIAPGSWMTLSVEPGAALRPLDVAYADGTTGELGGFALGINLGLSAAPFEDQP